jgi:hypothetical protein
VVGTEVLYVELGRIAHERDQLAARERDIREKLRGAR